ncbi:MAG: site-specific integrase [Devosia sp.]|nr:site-specific integrase [Devosia sp.]
MHTHAGASLTLFTRDGRRKYLTPAERERFITAAWSCARAELGTLCLVLAYSGCRISEALALTVASVDPVEGVIVFRSLKKRNTIVFRQVPVPPELTARLAAVHHLASRPAAARLWSLSRSRAWQLVKIVMIEAQVAQGPHCTPKGLRHGFGIHAVRSNVPLNLVQRWLGHASLATTAIYLDALGDEERELASRMWGSPAG